MVDYLKDYKKVGVKDLANAMLNARDYKNVEAVVVAKEMVKLRDTLNPMYLEMISLKKKLDLLNKRLDLFEALFNQMLEIDDSNDENVE